MSERDFQQQFVEWFRHAAPGYPQPVTDYRDGLIQFDLAWPEQMVAVEFNHKVHRFYPTHWRIITITSKYWVENSQRAIREVRMLLDF